MDVTKWWEGKEHLCGKEARRERKHGEHPTPVTEKEESRVFHARDVRIWASGATS